MSQPESLDRHMSDLDLLKIWCSPCQTKFYATKRQAILRFGPEACPLVVGTLARCPNCGLRECWSQIVSERQEAPFRLPLSVGVRKGLTLSVCRRQGWIAFGSCDRCDDVHQLGDLEQMIRRGVARTLYRLVGRRLLQCTRCEGPGRIGRVLVLKPDGEPVAEFMADPEMRATPRKTAAKLAAYFQQHPPPTSPPTPPSPTSPAAWP